MTGEPNRKWAKRLWGVNQGRSVDRITVDRKLNCMIIATGARVSTLLRTLYSLNKSTKEPEKSLLNGEVPRVLYRKSTLGLLQ